MLNIILTPEQMMRLYSRIASVHSINVLLNIKELRLRQYIKGCAQTMNSDRIPCMEIEIPEDISVLTEPLEQIGLKINHPNVIAYEVVKWRLENAV